MARLNDENVVRARELISLYPHKRSALIPALHLLQEQDGYLSPDGIEHVAELVDLTPAEVRGTASFYEMLHLKPVGRYLVAVCTNIACMLAGAYELLEHMEQRLGVSLGGTTTDGTFTLEDTECLALCGNAPCLVVNWRYFGDMTPERWDTLVHRPGRGPAGRRSPAPRHPQPRQADRRAPGRRRERKPGGQGRGTISAPGTVSLATRQARRSGGPYYARHRWQWAQGAADDVSHDSRSGEHP